MIYAIFRLSKTDRLIGSTHANTQIIFVSSGMKTIELFLQSAQTGTPKDPEGPEGDVYYTHAHIPARHFCTAKIHRSTESIQEDKSSYKYPIRQIRKAFRIT